MTAAAPINYLTLYKEPGRDVVLAAARAAPPFFDRITRAWIVADPELCRELLASPNLLPAPVVEHYRNLPEHLAQQLGSIAFAFDHIPLCLAGAEHSALRRRASEYLASRRQATEDWMRNGLPDLAARFGQPGRFDAVSTVIEPIVAGLIEAIVGFDLPRHLHLEETSQIFDKSISLSRRTRLSGLIEGLRAHVLERLGPGADDDEAGMRLGLAVIGRDATIGSIAESLVRMFGEAEGQPLSALAYPRYAPQTGVPFVERVVEAPVELAGTTLEPGTRLRLVLQSYALSPPDSHHRFFGAGAHACLGRPVATELWQALGNQLRQLDSRVRVVSYELDRSNFVFNIPRQFEVEVTA